VPSPELELLGTGGLNDRLAEAFHYAY